MPLSEFLVGLGLLLGCLTTAAAFFGLLMNFSFMLAGTVSHNPKDVFFGMIILFAGSIAAHYGSDRWMVPFFRRTINKKAEENVKTAA